MRLTAICFRCVSFSFNFKATSHIESVFLFSTEENDIEGVRIDAFSYVAVLQFVGAGDDPRSCRFFQMMEQRLEKVFFEAQAKVFSTNSRLSVQVLCSVLCMYYICFFKGSVNTLISRDEETHIQFVVVHQKLRLPNVLTITF